MNDSLNITPDYDAIVVGAGLGGLYALFRLRSIGLNVQGYERGDGVGGTWYWNRYPGLQCDTETLSYSFTFNDDLYRGWNWSRRFALQDELMAYSDYMAERLDVKNSIQFNTNVESAHYDGAANVWRIGLSTGETVSARYFVPAPGPLSTTTKPTIEGIENFSGEVYHTAEWPHEPIDLTGKRVGVFGTGSSGAQLIVALADKVEELVVFQRTPQYITPAQQRFLDPAEVQDRKDNLDDLRNQMRSSDFGAPGTGTERSAFEDTEEERNNVFEAAWEWGAQAFALATYNDLTKNEEANAFAADFVRSKITQIVEDPETARKLMPDYLFGTKRPIKVDNYYETFNRDNVKLVALKEEPVVTATAAGIQTAANEYDLDVIIFATGFDAMTGTLFKMDLHGRDGLSLRDAWDNGVHVRTALGVATNGFPNMFLVQGPQSTTIMNNYTLGIEINMDWIAGLIQQAQRDGVAEVEAAKEAEDAWAQHCQFLAEQTLLLKTDSWWTGANIEGKPRPKYFQSYTGGILQYRLTLEKAAEEGYPQFTFDGKPLSKASVAA